MHIAVYSRKKTFYSTRRLLETIARRGHNAVYINPAKIRLSVDKDGQNLKIGRKRCPDLDTIIARVNILQLPFGLTVSRFFESRQIQVINNSNGTYIAGNKLRTLQRLADSRLPVPPTLIIQASDDIERLAKQLAGPPVIVKLLRGTQGVGVMLADTIESLRSLVDVFSRLDYVMILQKYYRESKGEDVRAFVLGNKVIAALHRKARSDEFRSNLHRGGTGQLIQLKKREEQTVLKAVRVVGLEYAGVDLLRTNDGVQILEVNASPGFQGIEAVSELDIAGEIVKYCEKTHSNKKENA